MITLEHFRSFLKGLVLTRIESVEKLEKDLSHCLGFKIVLEEATPILDYRFIINLDLEDKDLYVDIYYLLDSKNNLFITEFSLDSDHALNYNVDKLKGVSKWQ